MRNGEGVAESAGGLAKELPEQVSITAEEEACVPTGFVCQLESSERKEPQARKSLQDIQL